MILPVTQIGSLPFDNPIDAVHYSRKHPIPFLPELVVARGEYMHHLVKDPTKLSSLEEFTKQPIEQVKLQCVGPITLRQILLRQGEECTISDAMGMIRRYLDFIFERVHARQTILFLDEPSLKDDQVSLAERLWQEIFGAYRATPGVHHCGPVPFEAMLRSSVVNIISFDASKYKQQAAQVLSRRNGKRIAWGIKTIDDVLEFRDGDLITPPCGLSYKREMQPKSVPYTAQECETIYTDLIAIAQKLTAKP